MARLKHPAHGWHVLSPFDDLSKMQAAGWVVEEQGAAPQGSPLALESQPVTQASEQAPEPATNQPVKRKPGRPRKEK